MPNLNVKQVGWMVEHDYAVLDRRGRTVACTHKIYCETEEDMEKEVKMRIKRLDHYRIVPVYKEVEK